MGSDNSNKTNKNLSNATNVISALAGLAAAATPLVNNAIENAKNKSSERSEEKVKIPELYSKGFPIDLDQAIKILEDCGLKVSKSKLTLRDAKPLYKDCFDLQVINSNPKQGSVVKVGSTVCLRYISDDVIAESQKIFDEKERVKSETKERKVAERTERKEHTRETISSVADKAKSGMGKVFKRNSKSSEPTEKGE